VRHRSFPVASFGFFVALYGIFNLALNPALIGKLWGLFLLYAGFVTAWDSLSEKRVVVSAKGVLCQRGNSKADPLAWKDTKKITTGYYDVYLLIRMFWITIEGEERKIRFDTTHDLSRKKFRIIEQALRKEVARHPHVILEEKPHDRSGLVPEKKRPENSP
jgi:hypothetical protein